MTKVIFRVDERDSGYEVLAFFPELAGDNNPYRTCLSYAHIGQHGAADVNFSQWTRPVKPDEYADLLKELEGIYDNLIVSRRVTRLDFEKRKEQVGG